ncbi:hypothetical protein [Polyangium spumosum]|uniref:Outer membrane beta-barrel protein n=1 Tax=Polyangium spumosum TaxID=889282 RepID=A0A6N7PYW2_9BACT|nr:hypothetical protein [Polyangium spumosum]MRG93911.1 hypothetical protein [Polyangium spumosum]
MRATATKIRASRQRARAVPGALFCLCALAPFVLGAAPPAYVTPPPDDPLPELPPPPPDPAPAPHALAAGQPAPRERSTVEMARLGAGVLYVRGLKRLGFGTLARYDVLVGVIDLDVVRFPHERLGFEIHLHGGPIGFDENARVEIGVSGAGLVAPLRWKGRAPGSFVLGVGGAFELGRPVWLDPGYHGAAFALARFRIFPTETVGLQTNYRFVPITTNELSLQEHDVELGVSRGLLQVGARLRIDEVRGGEPYRLYRSIGGGLFVGLVVF